MCKVPFFKDPFVRAGGRFQISTLLAQMLPKVPFIKPLPPSFPPVTKLSPAAGLRTTLGRASE